jgi:glycosyltransferase involved in cell wall biosynthesis
VAALAAGLDAGGATDEAQRLLDSRLLPRSLERTVATIWFLWWRGRAQEAWAIARPLPPADVGPSLLVRLGRSLRAAGRLEDAMEAYANAAALDPEQGQAQHWADVLRGVWITTTGRWHDGLSETGSIDPVPGRVIHLVAKSRPYAQVGYTLRTHYEAMGQQVNGLEPHIITAYGFPLSIGIEGAPASQLVDGVPHHHMLPADGRVPTRLDVGLTAGVKGAAALVRELRPAVIQAASDYKNALVALRLGELFRLPVVYEVRGFWEESWLSRMDREADSDLYLGRQERETECMRRADALVTLSEGMADEIVARGVDRSRITLVPNGVDVERFVPARRDPRMAARWGIGSGEVTLGYISTFSPYEGITYLLQAAARLVARGLPIRVLLVGDGVANADLQAEVDGLGIRERVTFTGQVPHEEILDYYGLIDIFVVPRSDDRVSHLVTPLKPLEAMATGRAMIVSGVRALRGMVEEGVTAEVFRPEDPAHLAEVAERLVVSPALRDRLGAAARGWVVEHRSWSRVTKAYVGLYEALASSAATDDRAGRVARPASRSGH